MPNQARVAKVLAALLASMTTGAIVLMVLGNNPPAAGPFSLWTYYCLDPVKTAISADERQFAGRWNRIEIYYSGTRAGNVKQLISREGLSNPKDANFHFCLCNGLGGSDGQILPTEKWRKQWPAIPGRGWYGNGQTIRICIVADGKTTMMTDNQTKRLQVLVEALCKRFSIRSESIGFPQGWS
ncbi:MAG: N-acetylmuramoyl-L-alanine amidase [Phycisphaerales bacterium]|nr:MAG: N-acetylmuramoyl-L-alanine amidase [Phycisphaerales bacterium]